MLISNCGHLTRSADHSQPCQVWQKSKSKHHLTAGNASHSPREVLYCHSMTWQLLNTLEMQWMVRYVPLSLNAISRCKIWDQSSTMLGIRSNPYLKTSERKYRCHLRLLRLGMHNLAHQPWDAEKASFTENRSVAILIFYCINEANLSEFKPLRVLLQ